MGPLSGSANEPSGEPLLGALASRSTVHWLGHFNFNKEAAALDGHGMLPPALLALMHALEVALGRVLWCNACGHGQAKALVLACCQLSVSCMNPPSTGILPAGLRRRKAGCLCAPAARSTCLAMRAVRQCFVGMLPLHQACQTDESLTQRRRSREDLKGSQTATATHAPPTMRGTGATSLLTLCSVKGSPSSASAIVAL